MRLNLAMAVIPPKNSLTHRLLEVGCLMQKLQRTPGEAWRVVEVTIPGSMRMHITTPLSDELGKYLDLSGLELKLTAQNMANVDTPGYRTVGFDFAEEMQRSLGEELLQRRAVTGGAQKATKREMAVSVKRIGGLIERPDGNNVSMDREGMKMAEAQLQFRTGVELLKSEFTRILDAIHADSK